MNFELQTKIADDISLLLDAQDYVALRSYFSFWASEDEMIEKIFAWARLFMPTVFRDPSPEFHYTLIRKLFSSRNEYTACPRGFAKTTLNQLAISFKCAHRLEKFIVVVEKNFTEAAEVIDLPRRLFADDPFVRAVYGDLIKTDASGHTDERNKDAQGDVLINGVRVRAKGFNAPIRGLKSAEYRPTLILIDDVEEDTHILNDDQRRKYRENYAQGIVPAVDVEGTIKVTGTILHHDSLLMSLINQFEGSIYKAYDPLASDPMSTLLWPSRWTWERLMDKKKQMEIDGQGSSKFYQEYLNQPVDDALREFKEEWLSNTYNQVRDLKFRSLNRYIAMDVAESKNKGADYTAVVVVDVDSDNNWYIRHTKRYKKDAAERVDLIFDLWNHWSPQTIGVEKKAFEYEVRPYLTIRSSQDGVYPHVVELKHGGQAKETRIIGALQGLFENGKIYFAESPSDDTNALKGELRDFPFGKNDDLIDALAYIAQIAKRPHNSGGSVDGTPSAWKELLSLRRKKHKSVVSKL